MSTCQAGPQEGINQSMNVAISRAANKHGNVIIVQQQNVAFNFIIQKIEQCLDLLDQAEEPSLDGWIHSRLDQAWPVTRRELRDKVFRLALEKYETQKHTADKLGVQRTYFNAVLHGKR